MNGRVGWTREAARRWAAGALGSAAVLAGALALAGCGGEGGGQAPATPQAQATAPAQGGGAAATPAVAVKPIATGGTQRESADRESMPPGLDVSVVDTLVVPGQTVEFTAQATPDVDRIALKDGSGDTLPFVRDADGRTWRATYRVPLHPRYERAGLSVTARTGADRWRRVWVFLHVQGEGDGAAPVTPPEIPGSAAGR